MSKDQNFLTQAGKEKLEKELNDLVKIKRKEVAGRIEQAKEMGDISENAEYDAAMQEYAFVEGRIATVNEILKNAILIQETKSNGVVRVGSKIKIKDEQGAVKEYSIVGSEEADPTKGFISNQSPIGSAFLNKKIGEVVEVKVPKGTIKYKILEVQ